MAKIFISYASSDLDTVLELRDWLQGNGFEQVFYDRDPDHGIQAGERWQKKLLDACRQCEAVIFLLSDAWLNSNWCVAEYLFTRNFGKRCLPVLIEQVAPAAIPDFLSAEHQIVDLVNDPSAHDKLKRGLEQAGISADSFSLPNGRRPYPGLEALTEEDPAIFFGRDARILEAMDELRRMATTGAKRLFVILGASGAGKSSLLRAGLIPRLGRNHEQFLTLPMVRPDRAAVSGRFGLWAALETMVVKDGVARHLPDDFPRSRAVIGERIESGEIGLSDFLEVCRAAVVKDGFGGIRPSVILAIDQGEELFNSEGREESLRFLALIGQVLQHDDRSLVIIAMRSDAYPKLQAIDSLPAHLHAPFNLAPMHPSGYKEIIEGPARLTGLKIEPALTEALLSEATGADALPLLAYALERLQRQYGAAGELRLQEFVAMGGMAGVIATAVEEALRDPPRPLPDERAALLELLRRAFIPHLVAVDETGAYTRRIAQKKEIPEAAHPLIDLLVERRLLIENSGDKADDGNSVIEIAHEALLRSWPQLVGWLEEERDFLAWRTAIAHATAAWRRNERGLLTDKELVIASDWYAKRPADIGDEEQLYIATSVSAETARQERERRRRRVTLISSLAASAILLVLLIGALWQWREANTARQKAMAAEASAKQQADLARAREMAIRADHLFNTSIGRVSEAAHLAMESLNLRPTVDAQQVLGKIMRLTPRKTHQIDSPWSYSFLQYSPNGAVGLNWTNSSSSDWKPAFGEIHILASDSFDTKHHYRLEGHVRPTLSPGGKWMAVGGYARKLQIVQLATGQVVFEQPYQSFIRPRFDSSGKRLFVVRGDGVLEARQAPNWQVVQERRFEDIENTMEPRLTHTLAKNDNGQMIATWQAAHVFSGDSLQVRTLDVKKPIPYLSVISPTGTRAATAEWDKPVILWDLPSGTPIKQLLEQGRHSVADFSPDGRYFASATEEGDIFVWDAVTGERLANFILDEEVQGLVFSDDGKWLSAAEGANVHVWDIGTKQRRFDWRQDGRIRASLFTDDGRQLLVGDSAGFLTAYDLSDGQVSQQRKFSGPVSDIENEPLSGALAVAVDASNHAQAWMDMRATDPDSGELLWEKQLNGGFTSVLFSPNGERFATTEADDSVKIWEAATGELRVVAEASGYPDHLAFSADGRRLLIHKEEVAVVDTSTGKKLATIGEPGGIDDAVYNASENILTTIGADSTVRRWNAGSGELLSKKLSQRFVTLGRDGKRYVAKHRDHWTVFDAAGGRPIAQLPPMNGRGEFSDDGRFLVRASSGLYDPSSNDKPYAVLEIWDLQVNHKLLERRYDGTPFLSFRFLPENRVQVYTTSDSMDVFDARSGKRLWAIQPYSKFFGEYKSHKGRFELRPAGGNSPLLVPGSDFTEFRDQASGKVLGRLNRAVWGKTVPHRPSLMLVVDMDSGIAEKGQTLALIDWQRGNEIWRTNILQNSRASILGLEFTTDNDRLLLHIDGDEAGRRLMALAMKNGQVLETLTANVRWRAMWPLPDPDLVLALDYDTMRVWRLSTGAEVRRFAHINTAGSFSVATKANRAVTKSGGSLRVWDLDTLQQIAQRTAQGWVSDVAIRPDGRQLAFLTNRKQQSDSGAEFQRLVLWNLDDDSEDVIPADPGSGNLSYDPTGKRLAVRMGKDTVRVLDVNSLKLLLQIPALTNNGSVKARFSADGRRLFVAGQGRFSGVRLWDIATRREIVRLDGHSLLEIPGTTEIALRNREGWQAWDIESDDLKKIAEPEWYGLKALDDEIVLTGYNNERLEIINVSSGQKTVVEALQDNEEIKAYAVTKPREFAVLAQRRLKPWRPGTISLRRLPGGEELAQATPDAVVTELEFAADDANVILLGTPGSWAVYGEGNSLFLWHWRQGKIDTLSENQPITAVAVSRDGAWFATGEGKLEQQSSKRTKQTGILRLRVWDASSGSGVKTIPLDEQVYDVTFSPDGQFLAVYVSWKIDVYATKDWSLVKRFDVKRGCGCGEVHFGLGNRVIVTGGQIVQIWNPADDRMMELTMNAQTPRGIVSKNGTVLAVNDSGLIRLWDLTDGAELLRRPFGRGTDFAFAGETDRLFAYGQTLGLVEIPWRSEDLIAEACRRLPLPAPSTIEQKLGKEPVGSLCRSFN